MVDCQARACQWGISLQDSRLCRIQNCSAADIEVDGILLRKSQEISLLESSARFCQRGISLAGSNSCSLMDNNASHNEMDGISLQQLSSARLQGNLARHNGQGIFAQSCRELYLEKNLLDSDPFQKLDQTGVGQLVEMGTKKGRSARPNLKVGICGEHGGEPSSVKFCHKVGMNYVSCSPFRVPIARLAAAQAAIEEK